ncbi:hypothetical protein ACFLSJ_04105, partial [Verrucomicrobiota bacterium]
MTAWTGPRTRATMRAMDMRWKTWVGPALVVAAIVAVYAPVHAYRFLEWDDEALILNNPHIGHITHFWTTLEHGLFAPVTFSAWSLLYRAAGFHAGTFHLANLVVHILNALLVYALLRFLLGPRAGAATRGYARPPGCESNRALAATAGAALFALHPIQAETVSWIACLRDLL